jgi:hypothetical protein
MRKILGTIVLTAVGLVLTAAPAHADTAPLPPEGPIPTCWVDVAWFPNPDSLPPCPAEAQATLYSFARAIVGWESIRDIMSVNIRELQRANHGRYEKIRRLERQIRRLRAELRRVNG